MGWVRAWLQIDAAFTVSELLPLQVQRGRDRPSAWAEGWEGQGRELNSFIDASAHFKVPSIIYVSAECSYGRRYLLLSQIFSGQGRDDMELFNRILTFYNIQRI